MPVYRLPKEIWFPPVEEADSTGLLAVGGDLTPERLLLAYASGIFPWYSEEEPLLWWAPDPRFMIRPGEVRVSASMRKILRHGEFQFTADTAFAQVIRHCAATPRPRQDGTWITPEMQAAYRRLHRLGFAHSVEVWKEGELAGGLYGVSLGGCFFGESMFSAVSNASKAAFIRLSEATAALGFTLIDCQVPTPHLATMGAYEIPRAEFMNLLNEGLQGETLRGNWTDLGVWG